MQHFAEDCFTNVVDDSLPEPVDAVHEPKPQETLYHEHTELDGANQAKAIDQVTAHINIYSALYKQRPDRGNDRKHDREYNSKYQRFAIGQAKGKKPCQHPDIYCFLFLFHCHFGITIITVILMLQLLLSA